MAIMGRKVKWWKSEVVCLVGLVGVQLLATGRAGRAGLSTGPVASLKMLVRGCLLHSSSGWCRVAVAKAATKQLGSVWHFLSVCQVHHVVFVPQATSVTVLPRERAMTPQARLLLLRRFPGGLQLPDFWADFETVGGGGGGGDAGGQMEGKDRSDKNMISTHRAD